MIVKGQVIDVAEHSTSANDAICVLEQVCCKRLDQIGDVAAFGARGDLRIQLSWQSLPSIFLYLQDDSRRLEIYVLETTHYDAVDAVL